MCERLAGVRGSNMGLVWLLQKATRGPDCAPVRLQDGQGRDCPTEPPHSPYWVPYEQTQIPHNRSKLIFTKLMFCEIG